MLGLTPEKVLPPPLKHITLEEFNSIYEYANSKTVVKRDISRFQLSNNYTELTIYLCKEVVDITTDNEEPLSYTKEEDSSKAQIKFDRPIKDKENITVEVIKPIDKFVTFSHTQWIDEAVIINLVDTLIELGYKQAPPVDINKKDNKRSKKSNGKNRS